MMVELYDGALDVGEILSRWYKAELGNNYGAYATFTGTVRDENSIEGLSFDIYEPILHSWFYDWLTRAKAVGATIKMAHSRGDVMLHQSSYIAAVYSPKRRVALELLDEYVEDFKQNAPIWKYDIIGGERVYAADRSSKLAGAGILA